MKPGFLAAGLLLSLTWATIALAYRPFDGTDADVAAPGEFELEAGPLGYERQGQEGLLVGPALVLNYGVASKLEAVLEGRQLWGLRQVTGSQLENVAVSLKSLLREGSLQGATGVSVAVEAGLLLPGTEKRLGAHVASIFSWRWPGLRLHWNLGNDLLTSVNYSASTSVILEGPERWSVRPVAEILLARDFAVGGVNGGLERSLLLGAIAPWSDAWSFDIAVRHAIVDTLKVDEVRLGFTWSFAVVVSRPTPRRGSTALSPEPRRVAH